MQTISKKQPETLEKEWESVMIRELLPVRFHTLGKVWTAALIIVLCWGLFAYTKQLSEGLEVTAMRDYASWGIYISNFVFFVAISLVGSLITAILRLSKANWSTPLTRIAEIIAVSGIIFSALIIIVDMGRPDRLYNLLIHGRLQSPIIWDVLVITTYLVISVLLLYFPLLADFQILSGNENLSTRMRNWYKKLSFNWLGKYKQEVILNRSIRTLTILIIPLALAIHTVTAWLFATTYRPGWDSTNFGPYFVSGAFVVGAGAVIVAMFVFRKRYHLEKYITDLHFDKMGKLLVLLLLIYFYFNVNEYLVPAYKMRMAEKVHLETLFFGSYSTMFYGVMILGMLLPLLVLLFRQGRKPGVMFVMGLLVVIGAWFKRYLIVTPTLLHPLLPIQGVPESWHSYSPTWEEWSITMGTLAGFLLLITLMARYLPIIPINETLLEKRYEDY